MTSAHWTPRGMEAYVKTAWGKTIYLHKPKHPFAPEISHQPYVTPPPPPPLKRPSPPKAVVTTSAELAARAEELRAQAHELESTSAARPPVGVQLGLLLLTKEDYIKKLLKEWDAKGKGEVTKGEFRLHLRAILTVTSVETDNLFDSWDTDRGGSLDLKELHASLVECQSKGRVWEQEQRFDPKAARARAFRKQASLADEAAHLAAEAEAAEEALDSYCASMETRADVRLGNLLSMRRVKPGAVVTTWAKSRGQHAGELSKKEFRDKCLELLGAAVRPGSAVEIDEVRPCS